MRTLPLHADPSVRLHVHAHVHLYARCWLHACKRSVLAALACSVQLRLPFPPSPAADHLQLSTKYIYTLTHLAAGHALKHTLLLLSARPSLVPYTLRFTS
jgi:hypothetical protein